MKLAELVRYLDEFLATRDIADSELALNGLQVDGGEEVESIAVAVDACQAVIDDAANRRANLLIVHHGLFWDGLQPVTGRTHRRLGALLRNGIALYSSHLPLDRHAEVGNNAQLARLLGMDVSGWWGEYQGAPIGVWGELRMGRDELRSRLGAALGTTAPMLMPFGPEATGRVGIVTGAGGSMIAEARAAGLDTFITGEAKHHAFFDAEELGLNVFLAGHYATETLGVKALGAHLAERFRLPWTFIDHPTGL